MEKKTLSLADVAKPILKRMLPRTIRQFFQHLIILRVDKQFIGLERKELFDTIYKDRLWSASGEHQLSGPGSYGSHLETYVKFVKTFIDNNNIKSILDVGCGDFNTGSRICSFVERYVAADVSEVIIERNRSSFRELNNTEFRLLDVCSDDLPEVDLITIREVFQHLSNDDIAAALSNIEMCGARYVLLTEHLPASNILRTANLDKPRGPNIRTFFGSGVYIDKPPFNRKAEVVLSVEHPAYADTPSHLVTYLWKPNKLETLVSL